jgi:ABC-type transporter Mla subunit MlaD
MAISPQARTFAHSLLPRSLQPLSFAATRGEQSEYNDAITTLIGAAAKSLDASAAVGEDYAGEYLAQNSLAKLTGALAQTSIERLQDALATAWDAGGSYDQMVKAVNDTFDDFSERRAGLIAQTESADAYNAGRQEIATSLGFDEHAWETESGDPCPICEANEAQGYIDIDQDFASGDDAPTSHPNCLCVVNFRKGAAEDEE